MFRRALSVFLAIALLVLTLVVGSALLGLSGTESIVQRARLSYQQALDYDTQRLRENAQAQYDKTILDLELAYQSLGPNTSTELRSEILTLRYKCHLKVRNWKRALADIDLLRTALPDDDELAVLQVYQMILHGDASKALEVAKTHLAGDPDHSRLLELAGEACQKLYGERISEIRKQFARNLGPKAQAAAIEALKTWWYRKPGDSKAQLGRAAFRAILKEEQPEAYASNAYDAQLALIRGQIREAQEFYRRALEHDGRPVAAYRGFVYALKQGRRFDDVVAAAEIYLRRWNHRFSIAAAIDLAEVHLEAGRFVAVAEAINRYLPRAAWLERLNRYKIDREIRHLFVLEAKALRALGDTRGLDQLATEVQEIQTSERLNLEPEFHHIRCLAALGHGELHEAELYVQSYLSALGSRAPIDKRIEARRLQLEILDLQKGKIEAYEAAYHALVGLDPSTQNYARRARHYLDIGKISEAVIDAGKAYDLDRHDENALRIYAEAIDKQMSNTRRGSADLLAQCLKLRVNTPPEIANNALLVPLAELAFAQNHLEIAEACAREAAQIYNWSRWPRYIVARAALGLNHDRDAVHAAEAVLRYHPADPTALSLLRTARKRLGEPSSDLLFDLVLAGEQDADVALSLLDAAVARTELHLSVQLALTMERNFPDNAQVQNRVALTMMAQGKLDEAVILLTRAAELAKLDGDDELYADTFTGAFVLRCIDKKMKGQPAMLQDIAVLLKGKTDKLYSVCQDLSSIGRHKFARDLFWPVLTGPEHQDTRSGIHYLLGAQLAMSTNQRSEAEHHLLAAMSFEDGRVASRALTLLLTQEGRFDEAREAYWDRQVEDLVSACLTVRYGDPEMALAWTEKAVFDNPLEVTAWILRYLLSPEAKKNVPLRELVDTGPAVLEVLTYLQAEGFADEALSHTESIISALPQNSYAVFLRARALANAGKSAAAIDLLRLHIKATPADSPPPIICFDELIRLVGTDNDSSGLAPQLIATLASHKHLATPRMIASATRSVIMGIGFKPETLANLAKIWIQFPVGSNASFTDIELLKATLPDLALQLLLALEPHLPATEFPRIELSYYLLVDQLSSETSTQLETDAIARANKTLKEKGAFGAATHFLIDRDIATNGPLNNERRTPERHRRIRQLIKNHLSFYRAGKDNDVNLLNLSFRRLYELDGRKEALVQIERMLRFDPSLISIWIARSQWLVLEGQPERALAGLRWLYHYVPGDQATMACAEIAARAGISTEEDEAILAKYFTPKRLETPSAKFTLGLLALRDARYTEAADLLSAAPTRKDGSPLYFQALTSLALGRDEAAKELFTALETNYPNSSLSANAGHFARQLARLATAASSPTKR